MHRHSESQPFFAQTYFDVEALTLRNSAFLQLLPAFHGSIQNPGNHVPPVLHDFYT
jgi:hypothetical protein